MAMNKKSDTDKAILGLLGAGALSVPMAMAWLGHSQAEAESRLNKDKDFARRKKKLQMYNEAINAIK